jgi:methylmalonyl-CoA/ethylmalonyl-CoA epimerase
MIAAGVPLLPRVEQVGILVDDLDRAITEASQVFGVTRWRGYRYGPDVVRDLTYRGAPSDMSFWVVLSDTDPQIEFIQSVSGPSLYTEWLASHGHGVHHVAAFTKDLDADVQRLTDQGMVVCQSGHGYGLDGDGGFAYFDTLASLGVIIELIAIPARRRTPDREWTVERGGA